MLKKLLAITLLAVSHSLIASDDVACSTTKPQFQSKDIIALESPTYSWHGSSEFAVLLPDDGQWKRLGNKFWLWRKGYDPGDEPQPNIEIYGTSKEFQTPRLVSSHPTNGSGPNWSAMLVGLLFPHAGCWDVEVKYNNMSTIDFRLSVGESTDVQTPPN